MALAPESKLTYKEGGPAAEARFQAGVAGFESASFRGCGVCAPPGHRRRPSLLASRSPRSPSLRAAVTSEPFEVSDDADAVQMLTRSTQCGEFYLMTPPVTMGGANGDGWRPHMCDMIIYDEEADKHVRIAWEEAVRATMVDAGGTVGGGAAVTGMAGGGDLVDWYRVAWDWAKWNVTNNAGTKKAEFDALRARPLPYIVVARPFSATPPVPARTHPRRAHVFVRRAPQSSTSCTASSSPSPAATPARRSSARPPCSRRPTPRSRPSRVTTCAAALGRHTHTHPHPRKA